MAYGTVNSPGAIGSDLAEAKETAGSALLKADSNEAEMLKIKTVSETALITAQEALSSPKVTGIKGNSETAYRTGQVNLTAEGIGAAEEGHTHNYAGSSSSGGAATTALACTGNSATATKAEQDSAGQKIIDTYIKSLSDLSESDLTINYIKGDGTKGTIHLQEALERIISRKIKCNSSVRDHFRVI